MDARRRSIQGRSALLGLAVLLGVVMLAATMLGAVWVSPRGVFEAVGRALAGQPGPLADAVIVDLRLPRVVLAAIVGASLAVAGALYQALFRNPLADPYILGISSGAGLGATLMLVAAAGLGASRVFGVPAGAFAGAVLTILLVVGLASRRGRLDTTTLLLAGVAIAYTLAAVTSFILVFARQQMATVVFWMMGGLTAASWQQVLAILPLFLVGVAVPLLYTRQLNAMLLGEERAGELGVSVERLKRVLLAASALLVAAAVSVSGLIGFVGLMTPHMVRMVLGPDHRYLLPASVLGGAVLLVLADLVARTALAPVEIPVGIVTAVFGGPFFIWLLLRRETFS